MKPVFFILGVLATLGLLWSRILPYRLIKVSDVPISQETPTLHATSHVTTPHPAAQARVEAIRRFPALADKSSTFNKTFLAFYDHAKRDNPDSLISPDWPLQFAARTAATLAETKTQPATVSKRTSVTPSPQSGVPVSIFSAVIRVLSAGVIVSGHAEDPGQWNFEGQFFVRNHPNQKGLAEGDELNGMAVRAGNYVTPNGSTLRAYEYVRDFPIPTGR